MPALNFQERWSDAVWIGAMHATGQYAAIGTMLPKRTTIRKPGRATPGQTLYLYTGQRTPACRKLGEVTCLAVTPVLVAAEGEIKLAGYRMSPIKCEAFARLDTAGQLGAAELVEFFRLAYGLPFVGELIAW